MEQSAVAITVDLVAATADPVAVAAVDMVAGVGVAVAEGTGEAAYVYYPNPRCCHSCAGGVRCYRGVGGGLHVSGQGGFGKVLEPDCCRGAA